MSLTPTSLMEIPLGVTNPTPSVVVPAPLSGRPTARSLARGPPRSYTYTTDPKDPIIPYNDPKFNAWRKREGRRRKKAQRLSSFNQATQQSSLGATKRPLQSVSDTDDDDHYKSCLPDSEIMMSRYARFPAGRPGATVADAGSIDSSMSLTTPRSIETSMPVEVPQVPIPIEPPPKVSMQVARASPSPPDNALAISSSSDEEEVVVKPETQQKQQQQQSDMLTSKDMQSMLEVYMSGKMPLTRIARAYDVPADFILTLSRFADLLPCKK